MKTVKDVLKHKGEFVACISKDSTCLTAIREMNMRRIGAVVVTENEKVIGVFTERDVLVNFASTDYNPTKTTVGEVMTTSVAFCKLDTTLDECREVMIMKRIRRLPVLEEEKLVGIITAGDLLASQVKQQQETIEYLNAYIHGAYT